ncbi:hypothetical protein BYT27DRAFT_6392187 [Phlegmacium glaucopus]|nr:hypothetical protein BYT27DRAFT_6392187 [Phlegmacium glaucopus]
MSITVNALVTGLIIFKLFNVYREVKSTSDDHTLGATGGSRIRTVIFMLIKSGMMLFSIQLALFVVTIALTNITDKVFDIIVAIYQMLNGIMPTIMVVRVSMGSSFHDKQSMIQSTSTAGSLRLAANNPNPIPEMGGVDIVNRDNDGLSDEIQMVDR